METAPSGIRGPQQPSCPQCGATAVSTEMSPDTFVYGDGDGAVEVTATVPVRHCSNCGLRFLDHAGETARHAALCRALSLLTPGEIKAIRTSRGLTRAQFARLTRIGVATLSRWERGLILQTPANDQFLRLLRDPSVVSKLSGGLISSQSLQSPSQAAPRRFRALENVESLRTQQRAFHLRYAA